MNRIYESVDNVDLTGIINEDIEDLDYYEDFDTFDSVESLLNNKCDDGDITDEQYDKLMDLFDTQKARFEKYIEERSAVTNTDDADIIGLEADYVSVIKDNLSSYLAANETNDDFNDLD